MSTAVTIGIAAGKFLLPKIAKRIAKRLGISEKMAVAVAEKAVEPIATQIERTYEGPVEKAPELIVETVVDNYIDSGPDVIELAKQWNEADQRDSSASGWVRRNWRPINGIAFAVECVALTFAFIASIWTGHAGEWGGAMNLLLPIMTAQAGVVGYYVHARRKEKEAGVSR